MSDVIRNIKREDFLENNKVSSTKLYYGIQEPLFLLPVYFMSHFLQFDDYFIVIASTLEYPFSANYQSTVFTEMKILIIISAIYIAQQHNTIWLYRNDYIDTYNE